MRKHITTLLLFVLLFTLPILANELIHGPYLQDAQPTEITIMWETKSATVGKVLFGLDKSKLTNSVSEDETETLHQIRLKNLEPHQSYFYKCTWENGETIIGKFRTAPADDSTPMRFAVVGDSRSDLTMCIKISDLIIDKDPDIVLHSGDIVASGKNLHEWKTFLFEPMEELLQNIPFYPVLGNHEQESPHYYNFFLLHNKKPWWSVDYGSVHIIGLDTSVPTDPESEQYKFLLADLKKNKKPWTIVVFHYPLFHSHPDRPVYEFRYDWQPLFMEYGMFELERNLKDKLGTLLPKENEKGIISIDTTFTIETNFYMPVKGNYEWQISDTWETVKGTKTFTIVPGGKLQIEFIGGVDKKHFMPTPELKLHIEADNSTRNITGHRPYQNYLGFRNQDLQFSIEEAAYKNAVLSSSEDLSPMFFFLDYYADSKHAYDVIVALGAKILRTQDKRILYNLEILLKNHPTDLNKFRIYPFYFLFDDFSHLDEWIDVMGRLPSEQLSFAPKLICQLTELDNFNSHNIKDWDIIGPFAASEGKGLTTAYPPELEVNFAKSVKSGDGKNIQWIEYNSGGKSIDLIKALNAKEYAFKEGVAYAHTTVTAQKSGEILLLLGSNDDPAVWVNSKEVHRKNVARGVQACADIIIVPVKKGKNDILIKVVQRGGAWGLNLRISDWMRVLE